VARPRQDLTPKLAQELGRLKARADRAKAQADALDQQFRQRVGELHAQGAGGMQSIADATGVSKAWVGLIVKDERAKATTAPPEPCAVAGCPNAGAKRVDVNGLELDVYADHAKALKR